MMVLSDEAEIEFEVLRVESMARKCCLIVGEASLRASGLVMVCRSVDLLGRCMRFGWYGPSLLPIGDYGCSLCIEGEAQNIQT